jgi:hypothetical protein
MREAHFEPDDVRLRRTWDVMLDAADMPGVTEDDIVEHFETELRKEWPNLEIYRDSAFRWTVYRDGAPGLEPL